MKSTCTFSKVEKSDISTSETSPEIPSDSESEGNTQRPMPSLPKLKGVEPSGTTECLTNPKTKQTTDKVVPINVNQKTKTKSPSDSPIEKLLLTLMQEVKGLKEQIQTHSETLPPSSQSGSSRSAKGKSKIWFRPCRYCGFKNHLIEDCYMKPKCSTCGSINHLTKEHPEQNVVKRTLAKLKAQPSQGSSKKVSMIPKPYIPCKYCGFNDHHSDECEYYPRCDLCGSIAYETTDCDYLKRSVWYLDSGCSRHMTGVKQYLHRYSKESGPKVVFGDNSSGDTKGYGSVNYNRITFTGVAYVNGLKHNLISISQLCDTNFKVLFTKTQGTIFNQNNEVVLIAPRRRDVYVIDMTSYNEESNAFFFAKASPSKKSDAADCIISFIRMMENLNEVKVKELRSDNGTEFKNLKLEEFYDEKETYHVAFSEDDEAISQTSIEVDAINFNENRSFPDDEFPELRRKNSVSPDEQPEPTHADDIQVLNEPDQIKLIDNLEPTEVQVSITSKQISEAVPSPSIPSTSTNLLHLKTNGLEKNIEPKRLNKALKEEGWVISMQEELNQFERNKVWTLVLVPYGFKQEEGIYYDETFAPVARLEAIKIFLAYAAYVGFMVYQMNVKSAFLNGKISEEIYVQQPPGYQANPKESHLVAVKRIFKYLKGTPNLGLWYPKGLGFDLKTYSDSEYAGCNLDRKSTLGGCQILGGKLVCWSAKKQSSVVMSSAEAEYVATAGCCDQVIWIKSQLTDYDVLYDKVPIFCDNTSVIAISNNPFLHTRTKHIDIRYHFIRDHILKGDIKLHFVPTDLQLADIFTKPLAEPSLTRLVAELGMFNIKSEALTIQPSAIYTKYLREFWYTAEVKDNTITLSLLNVEKTLSFNRDIFTSVIGLDYTKDFVQLPSHDSVKKAIAILGLADEKDPEMTSVDLAHSSLLRLVYFSPTWKVLMTY
ncbi:retrovirus-related pol polyprotein from transposon TNT 1-94 [Tanacetum coccineum]